MKTIQLNIFTNSCKSSPSTKTILRTYKSFCDVFGVIEPTVYCDANPNIEKFQEYFDALQTVFPKVVRTGSLSDGYVQSIKNGDSDYIFQLEGDWEFDKNVIKHTLEEIIEVMESEQIPHFRFNKRQNLVAGWDKYIREKELHGFDGSVFKYCRTNNLSNNPHIINRKFYLENMLQHIKIMQGSKGIEEQLNAVGKYESCLYGGFGEFAAVSHLDGKRS